MLRNMRWTTIKPAKPPLTEKNLSDQTGKVFIVTGATNGIGKALANILYQHNARVYIAARSAERGADAIAEIQAAHPSSTGTLAFIPLRLDDLTTIKAAAAAFLAKETRLDVLFNNAGVMQPPKGSRSVQGHELQLATNVLGHHLFTSLLTTTLVATAASAPRNSVRVVWVSSSSADFAPVPAVDLSDMGFHGVEHTIDTYNRSKAGNVLQAVEYSRRMAGTGIVSVALNPGFMGTGLQKFMPKLAESMVRLMGGTPQQGAYTELFAGFDPSITKESVFVTPYGKAEEVRKDLLDPEFGRKYWEWCDEQVKAYR